MADDHNDLTQNIAEPALLPPDDYSGRVLGDFEIIRLIGAGGMGQVYLARQKSLKRQVAIKVLKGELAANVTALRRFQAEAEAVANITHAHIVQVYAIGEEQGLHYMALEYVDGRNLRDYLDRKGLPDLPTALGIMRQVASALERAGELGFVHRDIKPENILLSKKGEVKVTDFGLSRCFATDAPLNLTQSGVTMGTPLYMSPEQVRGQAVDPRSDIYSFGVTCYHMLAGEPPFRGSTAFDVALQHVQGDARPLGSLRPDLPADLCAIVHRMMAKKPEDRYQSAREIITDLSRLSDGAGLTTGAMPIASGAFLPGFSASSTPVASYGMATQAPPTHRAAWRYAIVAGLALAAAVGGAALHRAQAPPVAVVNPADALADNDPVPNSVREKELRRQLADKDHRPDAAAEDILELAEMYIKDRRLDDALRLFDSESIKKMRAFEPSSKEAIRDRELINILTGLGRGIALAYQDRAEDSNAEFQKIVRNYPPLAKKDDLIPAKLKDARPINRGVLEQFFNRNVSGPNWRRAVGDAVERNSKNLGGKMPDELKRLRMIPTKGAGTRG